MQMLDTVLQRTTNPFIQVNGNKHKIIPTGGENEEQSKLKQGSFQEKVPGLEHGHLFREQVNPRRAQELTIVHKHAGEASRRGE